jgi:hypothetical protein
MGKLLGISTLYNELLWKLSDEMALKKEKPGKYTAEELMEIVEKKIVYF